MNLSPLVSETMWSQSILIELLVVLVLLQTHNLFLMTDLEVSGHGHRSGTNVPSREKSQNESSRVNPGKQYRKTDSDG